ncbi:MAG: hypothetical protein MUF54_21985 [Polyangiaceae bacterium]|jgi:hypothetical protein|nr:hypothetical protein [Polyangiaceae bacterium]
MGIDRIGKPAGPAGVGPTDLASIAETVDAAPFSIGKVDKATQIAPVSALDQLRAGRIDVDTYVSLKVEQATAHLAQHVDGQQLEFIRSALRAQLEQDPMLVELMKRATSVAKSASDGR